MVPGPATRRGVWCAVALGLFVAAGCKIGPYQYGHFSDGETTISQKVVVQRGKPHKTLDRIAWVMGIPDRILPLNGKVNNHQMSPETEQKLVAYLEKNDLRDVYVCVNDYDPKDQWRRLRENSRIAPIWRYSFGLVNFVGYTLLPNRVFGGDMYNPFTNTIYLNSDVPAVVLHEAAFAKDVHGRLFPGLYAAINDLPILTLWHHTLAVNDVLGYARMEHDWETERQTYRVVYPQVGAASASVVSPFIAIWWSGPVLQLCGAAAGHITGRTAIASRESEIRKLAESENSTDADLQPVGYLERAVETGNDEDVSALVGPGSSETRAPGSFHASPRPQRLPPVTHSDGPP